MVKVILDLVAKLMYFFKASLRARKKAVQLILSDLYVNRDLAYAVYKGLKNSDPKWSSLTNMTSGGYDKVFSDKYPLHEILGDSLDPDIMVEIADNMNDRRLFEWSTTWNAVDALIMVTFRKINTMKYRVQNEEEVKDVTLKYLVYLINTSISQLKKLE